MNPKAKGLIIIGSVVAAAIGIGIPCGLVLGNLLKSPKTDYGSVSGDTYAYDMAEGRIKYDACKGEYSSLLPEDAFNISLDLLSGIESYRLQGYGQALALVVQQDIRSTIIRDGERYFEESYSKSSLVQCAWRMYQDADDVVQYRGTIGSSVEEASFDEANGQSYSYESYSERMGRLISDRSIYLVSSYTVIDGEGSSLKKTDGGYSLDISLDPVLSVVNYVKQMKTVSDLPEYPSFYSLSIHMELDADLLPISLTTNESYYATTSMGVGSTVNGSMTTYFDLDGEFQIPSLNEPEAYEARG